MRLSFYMYFKVHKIMQFSIGSSKRKRTKQNEEMNWKSALKWNKNMFVYLMLWSIELFDRFACFASIKMCNFIVCVDSCYSDGSEWSKDDLKLNGNRWELADIRVLVCTDHIQWFGEFVDYFAHELELCELSTFILWLFYFFFIC